MLLQRALSGDGAEAVVLGEVKIAQLLNMFKQLLPRSSIKELQIYIWSHWACFRIRFRIDGVLHEIENPAACANLLSRIKLMANVSIAEKRFPKTVVLESILEKNIDLRVSVLPTAHGENIVMRILDKEALNSVAQLGF